MYSAMNLHKWVKNKPIFIAITSQQLAVSAEACFIFLNATKIGERPEGYHKLPPIKKWLRFYKNHQNLQTKLISILKECGDFSENFAELFECILEIQRYIRQVGREQFNRETKEFLNNLTQAEKIEFAKDIHESLKELYEFHLEDIKADVNNVIDEAVSKPQLVLA